MSDWGINWNVLGRAPDPGVAFSAGVQQGHETRDRLDQRNALSTLVAHPDDKQALGVLTSINPQVGLAFQTNALKQSELAREAEARQLGSDYLRGQMGPGVLSGAAPAMGGPGDITVSAPARPAPSIADVYAAGGDEAANGLLKTVGSWDENQRKRASDEADALAVAAFAAKKAPPAQRAAVIDGYRPQLLKAGWSQKEIDDFDPTDEALDGAITHSLGVKEAMAQHAREQSQAETARHNRVSEGNSGGGLAVSQARLDLERKREARLTKWGPQPLLGTVRSDTSDLDY